jgi:capsular polysaccharide biosynthesis protein
MRYVRSRSRGSEHSLPSLQLRDIAEAFLKRPRVILLVVLGFVVPTLGITLLQPTVYEASAKLVVDQRYFDQPPLEEDLPRVADAVDEPRIAEEVIERLELRMEPGELLENLSVEQIPDTTFIELSYKDANPQRAQRVVNTVGEVSSERIPEAFFGTAIPVTTLSPIMSPITVTMWDDASVPGTPVSPKPVRNGLLALVVGLVVGIGLALLMERRAT